jgi:hypothetical protein
MDIATGHARFGNATSSFHASNHQFLIVGRWVDARTDEDFHGVDPAIGLAGIGQSTASAGQRNTSPHND